MEYIYKVWQCLLSPLTLISVLLKSYSKKKRPLFGAYSIIIIKHNLKKVYNFIFFYIIVWLLNSVIPMGKYKIERKMSMTHKHIPVLIVGGGLSGLPLLFFWHVITLIIYSLKNTLVQLSIQKPEELHFVQWKYFDNLD